MESKLLAVVVFILDLIAFSLAIAAEQRRSSARVTFAIAEVCLLAGSVRNGYHTKYRTYLKQHPPTCETLRKGLFGSGAAFIVFTGILSELFYASYSKTGTGVLPHGRSTGIRMGSI
ncbi:hypothetical protein OROGR_012629 [Orobanche gracilis]